MRTRFVVALLLATWLSGTAAAPETLEGRWVLSLTDKNRTLVGTLEVAPSPEGWTAYLEGGPVSVEMDGNQVVIVADSRDVRGFVFNRRMVGVIYGDTMTGTYTQEGAAAQAEEPGPWIAKREKAATTTPVKPRPVELVGTWTATQEMDFRKYSMSLTSAGHAWLESYLPYYDQPDVRCTSIGLPALMTYSFPFEVIASENRLTFIYEYQGRVRRVWLDDRKPGQYMIPSRMGHSNARWEGTTLVIDTTNLEKTVRDFRGELISENARIEERYDLSIDGDTLTAVITVYDPENYERPPVRRRMWKRDNNAEIFPYTCDPDSFYLPMYEDGEMDMYIERTDKRF